MTSTSYFPDLPGNARLWVHAADRPLGDAEQARLTDFVETLQEKWHSHGQPVRSDVAVLDDRFLLLGAYVPDGDLSGCGIDQSVRAVERAAHEMGFAWLSPLRVFYRDAEGAVQAVTRRAFRTLVQDGTVTAQTPVFDLSVTTVAALRAGKFERPAGQAWHARVFRIPEPA